MYHVPYLGLVNPSKKLFSITKSLSKIKLAYRASVIV